MGVVGQGIADRAAGEHSEFQQPEHLGGQRPLHGGHPAVEFHSGGQRIHALFGLGDVGGFAVDVHLDLAGPGHHLVFPAENHALRQTGPQVHTENGLHPVLFENPRIADVLSAAGGLLGALEHQQHIVAKPLRLGQPPGQLQ